MRVAARHVTQDAFHPTLLATVIAVHFQLDDFFGVGWQLDSQIFQVEED